MVRLFKTIVSAAEVTAWSRWEGDHEGLQFVLRYYGFSICMISMCACTIFSVCCIITNIYKCEHLGARLSSLLISYNQLEDWSWKRRDCPAVILEMRGDDASDRTVLKCICSDMP
jgi:hypothetical protein